MAGTWETDPAAWLGIPNSSDNEPPASLCLVAEDVVAGLQIVIRTLQDKAPDKHSGGQIIEYEKRLKDAGEFLVSYFESLYQVECVPFLDLTGSQGITADRIGILPDGDYALYDSQALLSPGSSLPINYGGYHMVPTYNSARDTLPGSHDTYQLYIGFAPGRPGEMTGWALSWNQMRGLYSSGEVSLDAVSKSQLAGLGPADASEEALARFIRRKK